MPAAVPISRQWVMVLKNGDVIIDWGGNTFQDIISGEFLTHLDQTGSHPIQEDECSWLEKTGCIQGFDREQVYVTNLPELPKKSMD